MIGPNDLIWDNDGEFLRYASGAPYYGKATVLEVYGIRWLVLGESGDIMIGRKLQEYFFDYIVRARGESEYEGDNKEKAVEVYRDLIQKETL